MASGSRLLLMTALVVGSGVFTVSSSRPAVQAAIASIGPLTFPPDGTLFAADTVGASIFAFGAHTGLPLP